MKQSYFTSESVTEGHPDKLCDTIADAILDEYLKQDPLARVAIEVLATKDLIMLGGQITSTAKVEIEPIVRAVIKEIGYDNQETDLDYRTCKIQIHVNEQSADIALGVDRGGAGDQGIMFGYACRETENYMPYAIEMANQLAKKLTQVRKQNIIPYLRPDGKTQVTVEYEKGKPKRIDTILISTQHQEGVTLEQLKKEIIREVVQKVIPLDKLDKETKIICNPTGRFVIGGPLGDTGLTGRKIIVDTYGGYARHGGGAFSGKDPSKVDRSATYMARHIAKNVVANHLADKCEIEIAYVIGKKEPISFYLNTFGTNSIPEEEIKQKIKNRFNLTPEGIIQYLDLRKPIYTQTTNYGHFGKQGLSWEKIVQL